MADKDQPIIIKRVSAPHDHEEHGGAWKVAYADFMTAMMAFFLLLWLLSDSQDQKLEGIADYFSPSEVALTSYGGEDVLDGKVLQQVVQSDIDAPPEQNLKDQAEAPHDPDAERSEKNPWEELALTLEEGEERPNTMVAAKEAIEKLKEEGGPLADVAENIVLREKNGNLLIDILDLPGTPIFESGKSDLTPDYLRILRLVAGNIIGLREDVSVIGHTDAVPYRSSTGYSNWELSSDRANSTRRALTAFGIGPGRIERVAGAADRDPMIPNDPYAAENRRVTIELSPSFTFAP